MNNAIGNLCSLYFFMFLIIGLFRWDLAAGAAWPYWAYTQVADKACK